MYIIECSCIFILLYRYKQCQQQEGSSDCGLYAVAFAAILASGSHPSAFNFHQQSMRKHLHDCLQAGLLSPFPIKRIGRGNRKITRFSYNIEIFCYCRMPETMSKRMIRCDKCLNWFHLELCVVEAEIISEKWFCRHCL